MKFYEPRNCGCWEGLIGVNGKSFLWLTRFRKGEEWDFRNKFCSECGKPTVLIEGNVEQQIEGERLCEKH